MPHWARVSLWIAVLLGLVSLILPKFVRSISPSLPAAAGQTGTVAQVEAEHDARGYEDPTHPGYLTWTERALHPLHSADGPSADAPDWKVHERLKKAAPEGEARSSSSGGGGSARVSADSRPGPVAADNTGGCVGSVLRLADNDEIFRVAQEYSTFPKILPRDVRTAGRDGVGVRRGWVPGATLRDGAGSKDAAAGEKDALRPAENVAFPTRLEETDPVWDFATVCYLNARWIAHVLGAVDPDRAPVHPDPLSESRGTGLDGRSEVRAFQSARSAWELLSARRASHAGRGSDAGAPPRPLEAFYVSLPVVDPLWTDAASAEKGVPPFFYHTHYFVIAEVAPGGLYTLIAAFKTHYRVIDWLRGDNSFAVLARGAVFGEDVLVAIFRDLADFDSDIRKAWTPRINRIHHALFGTNKYRDMEIRGGFPAGTVRANFPNGYPVGWNNDTRVHARHFFQQDPTHCETAAETLRRRHYRYPRDHARPYSYSCQTSRFWHPTCDR